MLTKWIKVLLLLFKLLIVWLIDFKIVRFQLLRQQNPSQTSLLQHRSRWRWILPPKPQSNVYGVHAIQRTLSEEAGLAGAVQRSDVLHWRINHLRIKYRKRVGAQRRRRKKRERKTIDKQGTSKFFADKKRMR